MCSDYFQASKAAVVAFYETLRVEVGSDIHIMIVTPGFIESEMTKGKHLAGDGRMLVDEAVRDVRFLPCFFVSCMIILCILHFRFGR